MRDLTKTAIQAEAQGRAAALRRALLFLEGGQK